MSSQARFERVDWRRVPHHLRRPLERWMADGVPPYHSRFLRSVLANDLGGAVRCCVGIECKWLVDTTQFLIQDCPAESWGSADAVDEWEAMGGLNGIIHVSNRAGAVYGR